MDVLDLIVLSPAAEPAVAANRVGARGVLDLEFAGPLSASALRKLAAFAPGGYGVKLGPAGEPPADGSRPAWVVLGGNDPALAERVRRFRAAGSEVLVEAVSVPEAATGAEAGADGVILKGHEAGGRVGPDTSFVLVQKWKKEAANEGRADLSFWVRGGIGLNTAAACLAAGARGVVLDSQLLLARESAASEELRKRVAGLDGGETVVLGERLGEAYRVYGRADSAAAQELVKDEERLLALEASAADKLTAWRKAVGDRVSHDPATGVWLVGQDVATAPGLAAKFVTVAGIVRAISDRAGKQVDTARRLRPLAEGGPLAASHNTRYPILQGPMTRVSDTAGFADAVAAGGGLPFLALALMRKAEVAKLLAETKAKIGKKPWGVGVLGFVPPELRAEQMEAVRAVKPPFAIIAGGRPDQAKELEKDGTKTYLHVPSPGLLRMFLKDGARRFIFEGRECGGHVGPRASFALWEAMTEVLEEHLTTSPKDELHVVFAGGIHDALSAAMVSALAGNLAERGAKVGVLIGTAYLFTTEAVEHGAITARFQKEAVACGDTVLLETGPGHAIRVVPTPYAETFEAEKKRLRAEGKSHLEVGLALERMNLGRLRVASKGVDRAAGANGNGSGLSAVSEDDQQKRGMYMIGQVAGLWDKVVSIADLHADVSGDNSLVSLSPALRVSPSTPEAPPPCDVAIIGLSCFYPGANGTQQYWENILGKKNAVIEIPPSHWDWKLYYDADPRARDKMISKWGGFMSDVVFEPLRFGITPKSIPNIEPLQLLLLEGVRQAIADAGYENRPFERERTAAILGVGGGGMPLSVAYGFRACMPLMDTIPGMPVKSATVIELGEGILPEWTEDSFPGILLNVAAGRVSNRFNLGGPNMAIDAACGSSLAALYAGVKELNTGTSDVAVVMGGDAVQTPYAYVAFSKTHALSPKGRCRPFDAAADGIALAEGVGVAILKRLKDAERDGDKVYAVIKGVGSSSDGRDKGLTAPRAEGQLRALHRAYAQARVEPSRVGLVEAHGTGTVVGDQTEATAIGTLMRDAGGQAQSCALGSVKSMIGHSKCAAGLAGLIKAAFALHHKVLPPTLAETPNPRANLDGGPLYLNTEARPWVHGATFPRTAGVSAFGFGGTNFHTVLEEYTGGFLDRPSAGFQTWPAELFVWRRADKAGVVAAAKHCRDALAAGASPTAADLAAAVWNSSRNGAGQPTLAVVATSLDDLKAKLDAALGLLAKPDARHADPRGIYFAEKPGVEGGRGKVEGGMEPSSPPSAFPLPPSPKVAFLFPGQGSQYPDMLAQQAMAFPEVREVLDAAERTLADRLDRSLGKLIYPPSPFTPEQEKANRAELQRTEVAQPALGATSLGMARLLAALGVEPDFLAGHSYGEYAALAAAGAMSAADLFRLSHRRGEVVRDAAGKAGGGMIAVDGPADAVAAALKGLAEVWPANHNSPTQTVVAGTEAGLKAASEKLQAAGVRSQRIPVACGFHSPLIAAAKGPLAEAIAAANITAPRKPVFSNTTAAAHPADPAAIAATLADHLASPVRFRDEVEAMHAAGARVFVEVGPNAVLTGLASQTLAGKPHLAVASDQKARPGLVQLAHLLGQLLAAGVPARLDRLFQGRNVAPFEITKLTADTGKVKPPATAWVVNGVRSRPINGPEPRLLGHPLPEDGGPPVPARAARQGNKEKGRGGEKPAVAAVKPAALPLVPTAVTPAPAARIVVSPPLPVSVSPPLASPASQPRRVPMSTPDPTPGTPAAYAPSGNGANGHHRAPAPSDAAAQVMMRFQDVMARFLDTQRSVMLGYLGAGGQQPVSAPLPSVNGTNGYHANGNGHPLPAVAPAPAPAPVVPPAIANRMAPAPAPVPSANGANGHYEPAPAVNGHAPAAKPAVPVAKPAEPAPAVEAAPAAGPMDRDTLLAKLLDLVSERTGYPQEALSIDLDLEADLGIDSIKRVEILGTLSEGLGTADGKAPALEMEKLSTLKTLRGIADYVSDALAGGGTDGPAVDVEASIVPPESEAAAEAGVRKGEVQRLVVRLIDAPLPDRPKLMAPSGTVLLTDDRQGVAQELADRLADLDVKTALVRHGSAGEKVPDGAFAADLTDPAAVTDLLARVHERCGPVAGLVHLLPLAEPADGETPEARSRREVVSLYLLARGLETGIRAAGTAGGGLLIAATAMGGRMGYGDDLPETFFAGHGGVAGFTKSVAHEWPEATVRVVDLDPETSATNLAEQLLAEIGDPDGPFEVGHAGGERLTWRCDPGPLDTAAEPVAAFGPADTILVTGGARGITAKIAEELGRRHKAKLVLVGSSAEPAPEPADTATLTAVGEIKAALMKRMGADGKPAAVEAAYRRLVKDREIRANLAAIRATGATVDYRGVDVKDSAAFGALLDELNKAGGITGVIHGAGVIDDKLVRDKTPESFERVFGTKVDSAFTLARKLDPKKLKAFALFASVSSRYGNRGQADYAAANEVLSKLACQLDRRWPGRVVSVCWGPWGGVGMVADLEKHLVARGMMLIEPAVGAKMAADELQFGPKGVPEVVVAGGTEIPSRPAANRSAAAKPEPAGV